MSAQQVLMPGIEPKERGVWHNVYSRIRSNGTRLSIAIPPEGDVVIITTTVGTRTNRVVIEHGEIARLVMALENAREDLGL